VAATATPSRGDAVVVRVRGLTKRFPKRRSWKETMLRPFRREWALALDDVSCDVSAGEFFGLLGPNGAGKTTFLKLLTTLLEPDAGSAEVDGHDVVREPEHVRAVTSPCLANERSLYFRLTARDNLELYATLLGVPRHERQKRIDEALEAVSLTDTGRKMVGLFSSGMLQRILIARSLLARPRLLLLDEPTRSLDPVSARQFREFLRRELAQRLRCAVILATHSADEAFELCDRVAIVHRGRFLALGTTPQLSARYLGARYAVFTTEPRHPALQALVDAPVGGVDVVGDDPPTADRRDARVLIRLRGGDDDAQHVLRALVTRGMPVSRFESVRVTLAELIETVVSSSTHDGGAR
jgi:ABC-2 type transport system ATP-binding protein